MTTAHKGLTAVLLCVLALYAIAGLFAYPVADDRAFIELAKQGNVVVRQYNDWQGRYGYSFFMGVVMPLAPNIIVKVFPALLIVGMVVIYGRLLGRITVRPYLASAGLTLAFVTSLPSVWQSVMWYGSSVNYVLPLLVGGVVVLILQRKVA